MTTDQPLPFGIRVVDSPFLPPGTFLIGAFDHAFLRVSDPAPLRWLDDPIQWPPNRRPLHPTHPLYDVVAREREKAFASLEALLDDQCAHGRGTGLAVDPERAWRGPRRRDDQARTGFRTIAAEQRLALTIHRPADVVRGLGLGTNL